LYNNNDSIEPKQAKTADISTGVAIRRFKYQYSSEVSADCGIPAGSVGPIVFHPAGQLLQGPHVPAGRVDTGAGSVQTHIAAQTRLQIHPAYHLAPRRVLHLSADRLRLHDRTVSPLLPQQVPGEVDQAKSHLPQLQARYPSAETRNNNNPDQVFRIKKTLLRTYYSGSLYLHDGPLNRIYIIEPFITMYHHKPSIFQYNNNSQNKYNSNLV
jgi:hypothetical protein